MNEVLYIKDLSKENKYFARVHGHHSEIQINSIDIPNERIYFSFQPNNGGSRVNTQFNQIEVNRYMQKINN